MASKGLMRLKGRLRAKGITYAELAAALDCSPSSVTNKINEKGTSFTRLELRAIQDYLKLSSEEAWSIFFEPELRNVI